MRPLSRILILIAFLLVSVMGIAPAFALTAKLVQMDDVPVVKEGPYWVSEWREFQLPAGLQSFQILSFGSADVYVQVTDLIAPDGTYYVQSDANHRLTSYSQPVLRNVVSRERSEAVVKGMSSLIIPNDPSLLPLPGKWKFRALSQFEPSQKKNSFVIFTVAADPAPLAIEAPANKKLKIRVLISPDSYWTQTQGQVAKLLAETKKNLLEAKIDLEVLSIGLLDAPAKTPMKLPGDMAAIASVQNKSDAVNVYLMPTMEFQNKPINGLACLGGPINSPIAHPCFVSMYADGARADQIALQSQGKILTHELGHYLGLFHTQDTGYYLIGTVFDRLDDTPEEVTGTNMMDPGIHNTAPSFSPEQKKMLLLSPVLQN